jgi:hypothetical protein
MLDLMQAVRIAPFFRHYVPRPFIPVKKHQVLGCVSEQSGLRLLVVSYRLSMFSIFTGLGWLVTQSLEFFIA